MSASITHQVVETHDVDEEEVGPFVLNLCSIPGPIAVPQPRSRDLVKYAFFVSRGIEGDRECYWLHMGYFNSRDEAEKWQTILQRIYPLAFVTSASMTFRPFEAARGSIT